MTPEPQQKKKTCKETSKKSQQKQQLQTPTTETEKNKLTYDIEKQQAKPDPKPVSACDTCGFLNIPLEKSPQPQIRRTQETKKRKVETPSFESCLWLKKLGKNKNLTFCWIG